MSVLGNPGWLVHMSYLCLLNPFVLQIDQDLRTFSLREFWLATDDKPWILNEDLVHIFKCTTRGFGVQAKYDRKIRIAETSKYFLWSVTLSWCLRIIRSLTEKETPVKIIDACFGELSYNEATHPVSGSGRGSPSSPPTERVDFWVEDPGNFSKAGAVEEVVDKEKGSSDLSELWQRLVVDC